MEPKEENVEYHIEIQNCEEGVDSGNGEVMYVLDLGGADIPENIAMQLAQLAADGSLNLSEGTNSIMVQNEMGVNETHIMQLEKEGLAEGEETPQIVHLQMEEEPDYLTDATGSMVPPVSEMNFQDEFIPVEKSIFGKSKPRSMSAISLLDRGGKIERASKAGVSKPKTTSILPAGGDHLSKSSKSPIVLDAREKKGKGDKLPIYPFLKGKTPVMLTVAEDGQVIPEDVGSGETVVKTQPVDTQGDDKKPPIILDYSTEKSKLDLLLASMESVKSQSNVGGQSSTISSSIKSEEIPKIIETPPAQEDLQLQSQEEESVDVIKSEPVDDTTNINTTASTSTTTEDSVNSGPLPEMALSVPQDEEMPQTDTEGPNELETDEPEVEEPILPSPSPSQSRRPCTYDDCQFEASSPLELAQHLEADHFDTTPYHCFECEKKFKLKLTLVIHELIHQKDARPAKKKRGPYGARHKFYQCPLCSAKKKLKQEIHLHAKTEHQLDKSKVYTCEACKFVCYSEEELKAHNETVTHSTDRRSFCEICNQSFTNIYQHKAAVHSDARPFLCNQCGYSAKTKSSLRYHMVIHLDTKDWSCPKCSYKSSSERRLKRHMKIHDPNKKHQCSKCSFATHDAYEFKRHFTKVHSRVKSYNCKFCGQKFMKHHEIRLHLMFEHECNDAFFCNFCDFTCATRAHYKEHIQVHYGKNKHVCEICGFTGRYRTHYRRHMLTHTTNKPFTCNICFKSVREASNLRRHMLTHTEDKPLACSVCGYRCKIRSRLMNHMKTHSELRPFACHLCKYTTKFNGNLMKHLENHARYKPHKCQYCSYACNERNKLRRHMNFRHKGLTEPKKEVDEEMVDEEKELVILPSQEQFLLVPKEELEKIVSVDENGAVITADNGTIVVTAESQDISMADASSAPEGRHIVISDGDGSLVTGLKDRTILATLEMGDKNMEVEGLVTMKDHDVGVEDS